MKRGNDVLKKSDLQPLTAGETFILHPVRGEMLIDIDIYLTLKLL